MSDLNQANSFFAQGRQYANQNRLKEAEDAFRKAIELHPTYGAAYTWIGHILEKAGRIKDAEAAFQQAIHAEPLIEYHHSNLGTLFMKQERFVEAEASFRKALELTPMEDYLYFNLGVSLLKQNRLAEAEVAFRKVLEISPNDRAASEKLEVVLSQRRSETSEVTVQGATSEEHRKREEEIIRFREDCAGFIRDGYKFINKNRFGPWKGYQWVYFDYGHHDEIDSYDDHIDDAKQRFDWIIAHWEPYVQKDEIERMTDFLQALTFPKNADLNEGNFKDLALKTAFSKNKKYLQSLMNEIKRDVFDSEGEIRSDVRLKPFRELAGKYWFVFRNSRPPFENIIYFPFPRNTEENVRSYFRNRPVPRSLLGEGRNLDFLISVLASRASKHGRSEKDFLPFGNYIGMLENGKNEIRVIAQTTDYSDDGKFMYWDTFIDDIIPTLRIAIEWFTAKPRPIQYQKVEDTSWMDEAQDFYSDLESDGYLDDD